MATQFQTLITNARLTLLETSPRYWTDAELLGYAQNGVRDLWKGIIDLYKDHFVVDDVTNFSLAAMTPTVTVAGSANASLQRVIAIQPRIIGDQSVNPGLIFHPRDLTHPDFVQAEAERPRQPCYRSLYYCLVNAGAPTATPATIYVAPMVTSTVLLRVRFIPVLPTFALDDTNPIPGEADLAVQAWIIAWARARERPDRSPDPEYIAIYATEKKNLLTVNTPRSTQEPEVVESFFMDYAGYGRGEP
jgi:hypothetical protein